MSGFGWEPIVVYLKVVQRHCLDRLWKTTKYALNDAFELRK